jgi:hypothetical protein
MWQQKDDSAAFEPPDSYVDAPTIKWSQQHRVDSEMLDAVHLHRHNLKDKISQQLSTNALVNARTMLGAEVRQDIMLDMDKSLAYQEDEESL